MNDDRPMGDGDVCEAPLEPIAVDGWGAAVDDGRVVVEQSKRRPPASRRRPVSA